jgi:hypothetical protein
MQHVMARHTRDNFLHNSSRPTKLAPVKLGMLLALTKSGLAAQCSSPT